MSRKALFYLAEQIANIEIPNDKDWMKRKERLYELKYGIDCALKEEIKE